MQRKDILQVSAIVLLSPLLLNTCEKYGKFRSLSAAQEVQLLQFRDKDSAQVSQIERLEVTNKKQLMALHTSDSELIELQKVVKDYKGKLKSATIVSNQTEMDGTLVSTIVEHDTIVKNDTVYISPIYTCNWKDSWSKGSIYASKDSCDHAFTIYNKYELTFGKLSNGFLKKRTQKLQIRNLNPHTSTSDIQSFAIKPLKNRYSIGVGAHYGMNLETFRPSLSVGISVHYNLFQF